MVEIFGYGMICAMAGFLISVVLTREGEILSWYPGLLQWLIRAPGNDFYSYSRVQFFIHKLALGCSKCLAGQLAFWFFVFTDYSHVLQIVVVAIFCAYSIEKYYEAN